MCKICYGENYKILLKGIKDDLNICRDRVGLWKER